MNKATILIIEDDEDILMILKDQLELDGFSVHGVMTAEEGIKAVEEKRPDLVILDLNLPDIDGFKVCKQLRRNSDVPIIILTARDAISDKLRGFESGADDYVVKPFEYLELRARIKACLRRSQKLSPSKEVLDFGILKIWRQKREVYLNGNPIKLTQKEYELLELLATHPDEILSREFIKKQLWPDKRLYRWSRAVDVHIQRLRQKIEPYPEHPSFIITHPGVGYRFKPPER
jgi:two-component system alkaline phosphatase synthesis response regulator PhoP/OmpR family response regulator RpaB